MNTQVLALLALMGMFFHVFPCNIPLEMGYVYVFCVMELRRHGLPSCLYVLFSLLYLANLNLQGPFQVPSLA